MLDSPGLNWLASPRRISFEPSSWYPAMKLQNCQSTKFYKRSLNRRWQVLAFFLVCIDINTNCNTQMIYPLVNDHIAGWKIPIFNRVNTSAQSGAPIFQVSAMWSLIPEGTLAILIATLFGLDRPGFLKKFPPNHTNGTRRPEFGGLVKCNQIYANSLISYVLFAVQYWHSGKCLRHKQISRQFIATSAEVTPKGSLVRKSDPQNGLIIQVKDLFHKLPRNLTQIWNCIRSILLSLSSTDSLPFEVDVTVPFAV